MVGKNGWELVGEAMISALISAPLASAARLVPFLGAIEERWEGHRRESHSQWKSQALEPSQRHVESGFRDEILNMYQ